MAAKWEVGEAAAGWGGVFWRSGSFASALRERRVRPAGSGLRCLWGAEAWEIWEACEAAAGWGTVWWQSGSCAPAVQSEWGSR